MIDQGAAFENEALRRQWEREPVSANPVTYLVGLDLGDVNDYTALAIAEVTGTPRVDAMYRFRHLERLRGIGYPSVVKRVATVLGMQPIMGNSQLLVDQTGVGVAVVQMLRVANCRPTGVTITGGLDTVQLPTGDYRVPKRDLVGAVKVVLQQRRLRIAEQLPEASVLTTELQNFQVKITAAANDTFGAWREGSHDDLVLAAALVVWFGETYGARAGVWFI